ncbi:hypothetical protein JKP88DRAFT_204659 [Tribonema minus]|uniref:Rieske domain-containing protein n=1 Tax=Tribonema minus TaxID=303371 RepID=A0A835ZI47_9STRA|nr:hypothetical protein JKP88DRAFT_204659 [Tribonema minus]
MRQLVGAVLIPFAAVAFVPLAPRPLLSSAFRTKQIGEVLARSTAPGVSELYAPPAAFNAEAKLSTEAAPERGQQRDQFQWTQQWYALAAVEYLDEGRAHKRTLLGRDYVIWFDGQRWRAFADACPHRLAPLSEGRVEPDGTLMCSYHAWRFDGQGACTSIPQSPKESRAEHEARTCATSFPVAIKHGVLFVWPEAGPAAEAAAASKEPVGISELDDPAFVARVKTLPLNVRDLPYGWEAFFENVLDPAHVDVSHHNLVGNRYTGPCPFEITTERKVSAQEGLAVRVRKENAVPGLTTVLDWHPPCHLAIRSEYADGSTALISLYASPSSPGRCMHVGQQVLIKSPEGKTPPGLAFFTLPFPTWMQHQLASLFLHQDLVFLHNQQRLLVEHGVSPDNFAERCYMPNAGDKPVVLFKDWLAKLAGGGIPWPAGVDGAAMPRLSRAELFDVYETHTRDCKYCTGALKNVKRGIRGLRAAALVAALTAVNRAGRGAVPLAGLALTAYAASKGLQKLERMFHVYEFSHQDNN